MLSRRLRAPDGQILIIFAGSLLGILAIAALVIDLGFVFWIHRQEQDAADPAALAAARYIKFSSGPADRDAKMWAAACFYARQNGYFGSASDNSSSGSGCVPANDQFRTTLAVHYPPGVAAGDYAGRPGFVEVALTRFHQSFLAGLVGLPRITVSSNAVAAFNEGNSNSNSLLILKPGDCSVAASTLKMTGNSQITISPTVPGSNGGYIMVDSSCGPDSTLNACSSGGSGGLDIQGSTRVAAPGAYVVGSCKSNASQYSGPVTEGAAFYADPLAGLTGPPQVGLGAICPTLTRADKHMIPGDPGCSFNGNTTYTIDPGIYYGGIKTSGSRVVLQLNRGIYVMAGGGFAAGGGEIDSLQGDILIYSTDVAAYRGANCSTLAGGNAANYCQGPISANAQTTLNLQGLNVDPCPPISSTGCPYVGMLVWQDGGASGAFTTTGPQITINGGGSLNISGTIYNPRGDTQLNGNSGTNTGCAVSTTMNCAAVQIISYTATINGGGNLVMPYDPGKLYHLDNQGLVH